MKTKKLRLFLSAAENRKALASQWKRRHPENVQYEGGNGVSPAKRSKPSNGTNNLTSSDALTNRTIKSEEACAATIGKMEPSPGVMTSEQIKAMMANTMKEIQARKQALGALKSESATEKVALPPPQVVNLGVAQQPPQKGGAVVGDKAKTIAALQADIAARLNKVGMPGAALLGANRSNLATPLNQETQNIPKIADTRHGLILDSEGRTVDASGQELQLGKYQPTLKANLRAKRQAESEEHLIEEGIGVGATRMSSAGATLGSTPAQVDETSQYFDSRVSAKGLATRPKRKGFLFNDPGKYVKEGNQLRMKAQLEKLQAAISTTARKTGIASATQLAKLVPKIDERSSKIPDVEWWDAIIMDHGNTYDDLASNCGSLSVIKNEAITNLIEHPIQMLPMVSTDSSNTHVPVYLTKKELKKLRRQNRREAWKEKQDKIRLGLEVPDEAKVKMSNLMRVLGTEAVQDPTKVEAAVRKQMEKRKAQHEKMNAERKLTPEQRKDKIANKLKEDTSGGVHVAVYRIKNLSNPARKFKVETNAKQLYMTGCVVLYEDVNVVVVEGGPKQLKKYKQLMLQRIKWDEDIIKEKDLPKGIAGTSTSDIINSCVLVWEGQTKERSFGELKFKQCPSEKFAREHFRKAGVEHYWDQAYSGAVLEAAEVLTR